MRTIIIEVGSTITKIDEYKNNELTRINEKSIFFKKNYKENNKLKESDVEELIKTVNEYKDEKLFICGTSVFRNINEKQKNEFLKYFKNKTTHDFKIISSEEENELTVIGATRKIKDKKVAVFVDGGGSTEISIVENGKIKKSINSNIGVIDAMENFKDLNEDFATSNIEDIKNYVKERLSIPNETCKTLILAGGDHIKPIIECKLMHEENRLYLDKQAPFLMTKKCRIKETERLMYKISLDEIKSKTKDPTWWYGARMMCIFILAVMESMEIENIIPTNISMSYGIIEKYL